MMRKGGKNKLFKKRTKYVQNPALPLLIPLTLGKLFNLSEPQFSHLKKKNVDNWSFLVAQQVKDLALSLLWLGSLL